MLRRKNKAAYNLNQLTKAHSRSLEPQQIETSFSYKIHLREEEHTTRYPKVYVTQSYFLFPQQMKITPHSYPVENFYRDIKSYINFRIPKLSFREIIGLSDNPHRSPLKKIRRELSETALSDFRGDKDDFLRQEARMFACSLHNFIERKSSKLDRLIDKTIKNTPPEEKANGHVLFERIEISVSKAVRIFREWQRTAEPESFEKSEILQEEFNLVDEYIVQNYRDFILGVMQKIEPIRLTREDATLIKRLLKKHLRALRIYSKQKGYQWVDSESSKEELEVYLFRKGLLKRKIWSALYLDARSKPLFRLQKQVGSMIAAGFAGAWAVSAEILLQTNASNPGISRSYGFSTFIIATALIMAYIMKDRIKEIGKGYFNSGIFRKLPDSNNKIVYPKDNSGQDDFVVGNFSETVRYHKQEKLEEEICEVLHKAGIDEDESKSVVCYEQRLSIHEKPIRALKRKIRAVYGFYRLNIGNLLGPLDHPLETGLVPTQELASVERTFPKVYHIDLLIKIGVDSSSPSNPAFHVFRITVDKNGIARVERRYPISP